VGSVASFSPNPASDASTLSLTVPSTAASGSYSLSISGSDAGNILPPRTVPATLVVSSGPTAVFVTQPSGTTGYSVSGGKNNSSNLSIQAMLRNNLGAPVAGASVSTTLYLNGAVFGSATATTLSDGTALFSARNAPIGTYTTTVTAVTATGLTWDGKTPANSYTKTK
jgi:hypothetical protein